MICTAVLADALETVLPLLALAMGVGFLVLVVGAVLGWRAWSRTAEIEQRVRRLDSDLRALQSEVARTRAAPAPPTVPTPSPTAPVSPEPVVRAESPEVPPAELIAPIARAASVAPAVPVPPPIQPHSEPRAVPPPLPVRGPAPAAAAASALKSDVAPPAPQVKFEWERWLGVRGAAVLGGIFLIVAGFLFLQYSIERNWVTPEVRLLSGASTGIACLVVAHFLRKREYTVLSNSLSGAGVVLLYAVAWAAHRLYGLIEFPAAFAAMVAVTVLCAWLSWRHASQLIATLGLLGGFATPLVLSTGADRPIGLFGYALLLDLGFLFVAQRHRWPGIGLLALVGTFVIQGIWIAMRMDDAELAIGIGALIVFGLLFAVVSARQPAGERKRWAPAQIAALLLPFAYAIYFANRIDFGFHLAPLAVLAGLMTIAGGVLARLQKTPWLSLGTASGALALVLVWTFSNAAELLDARAVELVVSALALTAIQLFFAEWGRRKDPLDRGPVHTASVACVGFALTCAFACGNASSVSLSTWLAALIALPLASLRLRSLGAHAATPLGSILASGLSFLAWSELTDVSGALPAAPAFGVLLLAVQLVLVGAARLVRAEFRASAFLATGAFFPLAAIAIAARPVELEPRTVALLAVMAGLGVSTALAANGARSALLFAGTVLVTFVGQLSATRFSVSATAQASDWSSAFALLAATAAIFTVWAFLAPAAMAARAGAWRVAAAASLPFVLELHASWVERHGGKQGFVVPLAAAAIVGACAWSLWKRGEPEQDARARAVDTDPAHAAQVRTRSIARAWFGAVALAYASFVLPFALDPRPWDGDRHPLAVGTALMTLALAGLWRKSDHRALKFVAAGLACLATRELFGAAWDDSHASAARVLFNARAYVFLLPALAALVAAVAVGQREIPRLRGFELALLGPRRAPATALLAACAVLLAFAWLNLEVADAFGGEPTFRWTLHGDPRANLAQSIAWALFALALLVLGVSRHLGALRWASLFLFLVTIAKVFLLDLAHLGGLYRVASILGLALSLLLVSFLYQRFVFRPARRQEGV